MGGERAPWDTQKGEEAEDDTWEEMGAPWDIQVGGGAEDDTWEEEELHGTQGWRRC